MKYLYYLYIEYYYMLVDQNSFIREFCNSLQGPLDRSPYIIFSQQSIFDIPTFEISLVDVSHSLSLVATKATSCSRRPMSQSHPPR